MEIFSRLFSSNAIQEEGMRFGRHKKAIFSYSPIDKPIFQKKRDHRSPGNYTTNFLIF